GTGTDEDTGTGTDEDIGTGTDEDTGTGTDEDTGTGTDTESGTDTGTGAEPGQIGEACERTDNCVDNAVCHTLLGICVVSTCIGQPDMTPCETATAPDRSYDICIKGVCQSSGCGTAVCNVPGLYFPLADTGQQKCFNGDGALDSCPADEDVDFFGQDAQFGWDFDNRVNESRYTLHLDTHDEPMVQDNVTGLFWQGCHGGLKGENCITADERIASQEMIWTDAVTYCDTLEWGGYEDWRLPDEFALQSIVDYGVYGPSIDNVAFPATVEKRYWSSSSYASDENNAWYVGFTSGSVSNVVKESNLYARCVRSGP
ncbi:MAG: DUF1566 domain-containing protein, partial [Deltaproteobacteria bacterium]|nr:DUF1566 domain-containing protein [Deltaproteobacteria bacterium]